MSWFIGAVIALVGAIAFEFIRGFVGFGWAILVFMVAGGLAFAIVEASTHE